MQDAQPMKLLGQSDSNWKASQLCRSTTSSSWCRHWVVN